MIKVDFLILYENKVRELEAVCLLKSELKRRGYSVVIEYVHSIKKLFLFPKVIITPYLYDKNDIKEFAFCGRRFVPKLINLQWEQVLNEFDIKEGFHAPKNGAELAIHVSWGRENAEYLQRVGVRKEKIVLAGSCNMDLCNDRFLSFYSNRNKISEDYGIDSGKKWILFISSFTMSNDYVYSMVESTIGKSNELSTMADITIQSQQIIVSWFEKLICENTDIEIIYRPHPAELGNVLIESMCKKYQNFHCIAEESVRQWIFVSDIIYTWFSTSIIDAYYMNKNCGIIRPQIIPNYLEIDFFKNANKIETYEELSELNNTIFPIPASSIEKKYGKITKKPAYLIISDACEEVINGTQCMEIKGIEYHSKSIKYFLFLVAVELCKYVRLSKLIRHKKVMFENIEKNIYHTSIFQRNINKRLRECLKNEEKDERNI